MGKTALQLVTEACYLAKLPPPSALTSATSSSDLQLRTLFYETGRELLESLYWPQLKKKYSLRLESGREFYPLPKDYYCALPDTQWEKHNNWPAQGPYNDSDWSDRKNGFLVLSTRKGFRVFGPDINASSGGGQFQVDPVPGDSEQGFILTFEYISKSWLSPPLWTASSSVTSGNYRACFGSYYTAGSTTTSGTVPPTLTNKVGRDGGINWLALPSISAWSSTTVYPAGRYVTKNSELYLCTVGGTSGGTGPASTTTGTTETDGTVTWKNILVNSWTAQTDFDEDDHILISSQYYKAENSGKSGSTAPTWTETTVSDGAITWTEYTAAYDELVTDSDLCLFDDTLMISGLTWRFLRMQGLGYQDLLSEYANKKEAALNRYMPGAGFSLVTDCADEAPSIVVSGVLTYGS
jgi:hypothetical protein